MLTAIVGGYTGNLRTLTLLPPGSSIADTSLNIPGGVFKKEEGIWYVNSTFYDYYSDLELEGTNRNTLSGDMGGNGSPNKLQAKKFNSAVSAYFQNTSLADSSWQSPLYFGEFFGTNGDGLLNFKYGNNNGSDNNGARLGLVNSTLVNHKLMMGTDNGGRGVEAPYFSKEFLRGNNSLGENIGYVFEDISFPFVKDTNTGYWEFESYDASQTLRMKQTAGGKYFLDRVGKDNSVHGHTSDYTTAESNFFPFNDKEQSGDAIKLNYAFGVKLEIPFYMTPNGKVKVKRGDTIEEKEIEFNFKGDDDIWVFIDDKLVLDIGGDHGAVDGSINFATSTATTRGCRRKEGTENDREWSGDDGFKTSFEPLDATKQHVLTLYYMERGLWESNMFISFNFPKTNNLEIEKEVVTTGKDGESLVNEKFAGAMETLEEDTSFPISIKNMVTSGLAYSVETAEHALKWSFDSITGETPVGQFGQPADGAVLELMTADIPGNAGSRDCVLKYRYPGEKKYTDGQDVTDNRSFQIENRGMGRLDASAAERVKRDGYLELDAYLEAVTGAGAPFVALIDGAGNRIGAWANESAVAGSRGLMQAGKWVTLRIYMSQLKGLDGSESGEFQYTDIKSLQFAYWDDKPVYIDNVTLNAPAVYSVDTGFEKEQNMIPDYGSYASRRPEPISGAKYSMDGRDYYVESGYIHLKNEQSAMFSDQFRRNSYLSIQEECDENVFDVAWTLSESGRTVMGGSGTDVDDKRVRNPELTDPQGIQKPSENTMLFQTYEEGAGDMQYFDLKLKYTNTIKTGSLEIKKQVKVAEGSLIDQNNLIDVTIPYTIRVTFSNIAGLYLEGSVNDYGEYESDHEIVMQQDVFLEEGKSVFKITGIPAGTEYRIEEIETAGNDFPLQEAGLTRDDFVLSDMRKDGGNDDGEYDRAKKCYRGTIKVDENEEIGDKIVVVNDINPVIGKARMSGQKLWALGEHNSDLDTVPQAKSVTLKIQRRFLQSEGDKTNNVTYGFQDVIGSNNNPVEIILKPPDSETRTVQCADGNEITIETEDWNYSVDGLPLYGKTDLGKRRKYEYRFVETKIVTGEGEVDEFTVESEEDASGNLIYKGNQSGYQASSGIVSVAESDEGEQINYDVTNIYDPLTDLVITKISGDDPPQIMPGVTLRLERYVKESGGSLKKDQTFGDGKGFREMITDGEGKVIFRDLPDGNYKLTETRTIDRYNLLAKPIKLVINRAGTSTVEDMEEPLEVKLDEENGKMYIELKISNQGLLVLPLTGGTPMLYILGMEVLSLAGCGLYFGSRYHRKKKPKVNKERKKRERKKKEQKSSERKKRERKSSEQKKRERKNRTRKGRKQKNRQQKNRKQMRRKRKRGKR